MNTDLHLTDALRDTKESVQRRAGSHPLAASNRERVVDAVWMLAPAAIAILLMFVALPYLTIDFSVPVPAQGDALWFLVGFKSLLQNGWTWYVPQLSAPSGLLAIAFPSNQTVDWALSRVLAVVFHQPGALVQAFWILSVGITALTCRYALAALGIGRVLCTMLAVSYALLPWVFTRNILHISLVYMWVPALCLGALYLALGAPSRLDSAFRRFVLPACVLQGFSYIYLAAFGAYFLAVGAGLGMLTGARRKVVRSAALALCVLLACSAVNLAPSLYVWKRDGKPPNMDYKSARDADVYGLKIRELVLPSWTSPLPGVANAMTRAVRTLGINSEGAASRMGLIGTAGFGVLLLAWFGIPGIRAGIRGDDRAPVHQAAARFLLAGLLLATVGGIGTILSLVSPDIRAYSRIAVFLAFFCVSGFAFFCERIDHALVRRPLFRAGARTLLALFCVTAMADQMSDATALRERAATDRDSVYRMRDFVHQLEARLAPGSAVYQLPETGFPPDAGVGRMVAYDHARPYIESSTLRWSWPAFSRAQHALADELASTPPRYLAAALTRHGFAAVWIDRFGYTDNGAALQQDIVLGGGRTLAESSDGRYLVMDVRSVSRGSEKSRGHLGLPSLGSGFDGWEGGTGVFAWAHGDATLSLENAYPDPIGTVVEFAMGTLVPRSVSVVVNGEDRLISRLEPGPEKPQRFEFVARPGTNVLQFHTDTPPSFASNGDPRPLAFYVHGFQWRPSQVAPSAGATSGTTGPTK
jgi:hypothetical protein